jgi:hypothetical protein
MRLPALRLDDGLHWADVYGQRPMSVRCAARSMVTKGHVRGSPATAYCAHVNVLVRSCGQCEGSCTSPRLHHPGALCTLRRLRLADTAVGGDDTWRLLRVTRVVRAFPCSRTCIAVVGSPMGLWAALCMARPRQNKGKSVAVRNRPGPKTKPQVTKAAGVFFRSHFDTIRDSGLGPSDRQHPRSPWRTPW